MKSTHWLGIYLTFIIGIVASIAMTKASPALLVIKTELSLTAVQVGWIMSAVSIATVLFGTTAGRLSLQFGSKRILQIALSLLFVSASLGFLVESSTMLIAIRIIEGIAIILISVCAPTLIAQLSKPSDTGLTMSLWSIWIPVGGTIVFLAAPTILELYGWRWLWACSAFLALPLLLLLRFIPELAPKTIAVSEQQNTSKLILGSIILSTVFVCFACILFSLLTFLPSFLMNTQQLSNDSALWVTALLPLCAIPGCLLSGVIIHKGAKPTNMMIYAACLVILILSLIFNTDYSDSFGLVLLGSLGATIGIIPTAIFAQAPRMPAHAKSMGLVLGIVVTGQGIGILFGTPFVGYLIGEQFNWQAVYIFYLLVAALILILAKPLDKLQQSQHH